MAFSQAKREGVKLLISLAGGTSSGKTMSAMRIAQGIVGRDKKFAVIDTENGRASHYAPLAGQEPDFVTSFRFDVSDLRAPFRPQAYIDQIVEADKAGYEVVVVDSASHLWAGDGGCLEWHDELVEEIVEKKRQFAISKDWKFDEDKTRDAASLASWSEPKVAHKKFVTRLLQVRAHIILCLRAEPKIEITKDDKGKTVIGPKVSPTGRDGIHPVCEKNLPYEMMVSFLLTADKPGIPLPIKLQDQHKEFFPLDKRLGEAAGKRIRDWSLGGPTGYPKAAKAAPEAQTPATDAPAPPKTSPPPAPEASSDSADDSTDQWLKDNQ